MEYIDTPLFILNSRSDAVGLICITFGEPLNGISNGTGNCSAVPGSLECFTTQQCTAEQFEEMEEYARNFSQIVENNPKLKEDGNGLFEYSCYSHAKETELWPYLKVENVVLCDAVSKWFFSTNEPTSKHIYKDCITHDSFICNPTCIAPVPHSSSSSSSSSTGSSHSTGSSSTSESSSNIFRPLLALICAAFIVLYHVVF